MVNGAPVVRSTDSPRTAWLLPPDPLPAGGDVILANPASFLSQQVSFSYGEASLSFPLSWYMAHHRAVASDSGDVLPVEDALAYLWPDFLGAISVPRIADYDDFKYLLGCYNIDKSPDAYLFWRDGWGAPWFFWLHVQLMLVSYYDEIQDVSSGGNHGGYGANNNLGVFIRDLLTLGLPARSFLHDDKPDEAAYTLFHFRSYDSRFDDQAVFDVPERPERSCGAGYRPNKYPDCGPAFDEYVVLISESANCGRSFGDRDTAWCGSWSYAYDPVSRPFSHVTFHATRLYTDAILADRLLFWARAGIQYYLDASDSTEAEVRYTSHYLPAWLLGRFVLRRMLWWARVTIHEVGHVYNASGHCEKDCFMEFARQHFVCRMKAHLGVGAMNTYLTYGEDSTCNQGCNIVSGESHGSQNITSDCPMVLMCDVAEPGTPDSGVRFCATNRCDLGKDSRFSNISCASVRIRPSFENVDHENCAINIPLSTGSEILPLP